MVRTKFVILLLGLTLLACTSDRSSISDSSLEFDINELSYQSIHCYFFFITDCPASRNNLPKIVQLLDRYQSKGLRVTGIVSDPLLDTVKLKETLQQFQVDFAIIIDDSLKLAEAHQATVTPQVVVYDQDSTLIYSGLVDNFFYSLGKHRKQISEHYLEAAIQATLLKEDVLVKQTEPIGCKINFNFFKSTSSMQVTQ